MEVRIIGIPCQQYATNHWLIPNGIQHAVKHKRNKRSE